MNGAHHLKGSLKGSFFARHGIGVTMITIGSEGTGIYGERVGSMKMALVLFNGVTFLDFVGFYDVIYRLNLFDKTKGTTWDICGVTGEVTDELGMQVKVNVIQPDLSEYDLVFIPGGMGTRKLKDDAGFIEWIKTAEPVKYKVSVCTGSLLWGAAGCLKDRKATTHPNVYDLLEPYCSEVVPSRIVKDGNVITAGGVATSIDLGLFITELFAGKEAADVVKKQIDYPYTAVGIVEV
ncbi:dimethylglycine dehydrogenase [Paenibacillus cookii]|uniref:Dimethylglycine dehydrogenase n=2 Tax=Paenibacillus cookii TaxID=157839 RepID=A0ABQ4LV32_9BACL|nr:dimethylglycine dehydrogenase [Paenibacillus cookii]